MTQPVRRRRRRPTGAVLNLSGALILLVIIGLTALSATPSPPPSIAEVSPQAQKQITHAPSQQTSRFGSAGGAAGGKGAAATTTTTQAPPPSIPPVVVPSTFHCYGNPPRQTEDPQSPPCVASWHGNNGGATYPGVTADTITVVIPNWVTTNVWPILQDYFNSHFEFYGRKIVLVDGGSLSMGNPQSDEAAAEEVQNTYHAFAAGSGNIADFYFYVDLAREGIISLPIDITFSDAQLQQLGNVYQYEMGADNVLANLGNWACSQLAGRVADHAGAALTADKRRFGVVFMKDWADNSLTSAPLDQQLARCGAGPAAERDFTFSGNSTADNVIGGTISPQDATSTIVAMREAGVTSVFCACESYNLGLLMRAATSQGYFPEWLVSTYIDLDLPDYLEEFGQDPTEQLAHMMGVTANPRIVSMASTPAVQAVLEEDPTYSISANGAQAIILAYRPLLVLASGIQMAGPDLTAKTFQAGLARTQFPNPQTSIVAGDVGFNTPGATHTMTKDLAAFWWSNSAESPYLDNPGTICFVDGGARHSLGNWPETGDPYFTGTCDTGANL